MLVDPLIVPRQTSSPSLDFDSLKTVFSFLMKILSFDEVEAIHSSFKGTSWMVGFRPLPLLPLPLLPDGSPS